MTSDSYSFIRLQELIDAKVGRRQALLDEVQAIDRELAEARRSLERVTNAPAAPQYHDKTCDRCRDVFTPTSGRQIHCEPCSKEIARGRSRAHHANSKKEPSHVVEMPARNGTADR